MRQVPITRWVKRPRPSPEAPLRLFCFAHAGAGASVFSPWVRDGAPDIELCLVQLPGRENRLAEPLLTDMPRLLDGLVEGLRPLLDRPFGLFGHSFGALIAYEYARELRRRGLATPAALFPSGRCAPHLPEPNRHLCPEASDAVLMQELRRLNGTPEAVLANAELMHRVLAILRTDLAISQSYCFRDEAPLDCPICVFGGRHDRGVSRDELIAWRQHTRAAFTLRLLPGDHFYVQTAQASIREVIQATLRGAPSPPAPLPILGEGSAPSPPAPLPKTGRGEPKARPRPGSPSPSFWERGSGGEGAPGVDNDDHFNAERLRTTDGQPGGAAAPSGRRAAGPPRVRVSRGWRSAGVSDVQ